MESTKKKAEECLFVDDSISNISAAKDVGMDTVLFNRFREEYEGNQVCSFGELERVVENIIKEG